METPQGSSIWARRAEVAFHWVLLVVVILLVAYLEIVERLVRGRHGSDLENYERPLTLILLLFLSVAFVIGRYGRFRRIDTQFDQIARAVGNALPARLLTEKEVGIEALRLVHAAEHTIKVLIYEEEPSESRTISEEIAKHMASNHVRFEMVLVADLTIAADEFWKVHEERFQEYRKRGVESDFSRYIIDSKSPVGLDLLIIDDKHLGIAFSRLSRRREQTKELAIRFWDHPEVARLVGDWFEKLTKPGIAIPYEEAEQQYRQGQIAKFPAA